MEKKRRKASMTCVVALGQNNRGVYMRISEVKTNFRTAITIPEKSWSRFRDILADYCEKIKQPSGGGAGSGTTDQPHGMVGKKIYCTPLIKD